MKKTLSCLVFLCWAIFALSANASSAEASVRINEIAWMGTSVSGTNEWIELLNEGTSPVDLSGWRIEAADGSPNILLSGSIAQGGYYLIERTDDTTVPNITADIVAAFGNGLSNGGETLYLKDGSGAVVDVVTGGVNWQNVGGDNTTKQTAQRLSSGNSWNTATGTPRVANMTALLSQALGGDQGNVVTQTEPVTDSSSGAIATSPGGGGSAASSSVYPRKEITVLAGDNIHTFTQSPVQFSGRALGLYDEPLHYATYRFNFGDGAFAEGSEVTHSYRFPGEYTVTLEAVYGSLKNTDRLTVLVTNPDIAIAHVATGTDGFIQLANHSSREIDLSGWILQSASTIHPFIFPANTIISSGKSVSFPNAITAQSATSGTFTLFDAYGVTRDSHEETPAPSLGARKVTPQLIEDNPVRLDAPQVAAKTNTPPLTLVHDETAQSEPLPKRELVQSEQAAGVVLWEGEKNALPAHDFSYSMKWFFAIISTALVLLGGFIALQNRRKEQMVAEEYTILDNTIEDEMTT